MTELTIELSDVRYQKLLELSRNERAPIDELIQQAIDSLLVSVGKEISVHQAAKLSEPAFAQVWDNPEDAVYDEL